MRRSSHPDQDEGSEDAGQLTRLIWASLFFSLAIFSALPGLDLLVSARYYDAASGFFHAHDPVVLALYRWTPKVGWTLVAGMLVLSLLGPALSRALTAMGQTTLAEQCRGPWRHAAVLALCSALLGNGLIIEGVFKAFVGRPRPVQVEQFGGPDVYHGPFVPGPAPDTHRSFVSSHAAAGFALINLGLTCGPVWRRRWLLIGMLTGGAVGLGRMLQGGHFLSDILFAFYAVWLSGELVAWVDQKRRHKRPPPRSTS